MWNATSIVQQTKTNISTPVTGTIQKSNKHSFILRLHCESLLAKVLFSDKPMYAVGNESREVSVLQLMLVDDGYYLVEIVEKDKL